MDNSQDVPALVPRVVGLLVGASDSLCNSAGLVLSATSRDGPALSALVWCARWVITKQIPEAGAVVEHGALEIIDFRNENCGAPAAPGPAPLLGPVSEAREEPSVPNRITKPTRESVTVKLSQP